MLDIINNKEISLNEGLNLIPNRYSNIKEFIKIYGTDFGRYSERENTVIFDEVSFGDRQFMVIVSLDSKFPYITFRDDLEFYERVYECFNTNLELLKFKHENLIKAMNNIGVIFKPSRNGGGNESYLWFDLDIKLDKFTIELLSECEKLWSEYNREIQNYINKSYARYV